MFTSLIQLTVKYNITFSESDYLNESIILGIYNGNYDNISNNTQLLHYIGSYHEHVSHDYPQMIECYLSSGSLESYYNLGYYLFLIIINPFSITH